MKKNIQTKDEALEQVQDNNPTDYERLYEYAVNWIKTRMYPFTAEDLKLAYYEAGNPVPKQVNIFGAAVSAMAKRKLITVTTTSEAKLPAAHSRLIRVWISKTYSEAQAAKRTIPKPEQVGLI